MSVRATPTLVQARRRAVAACVVATSAVALALPSAAGAMTSVGDGWDPSGTESGGLVTTVSPPPMKDPVGFEQTTVSIEPAAANDAASSGGTGTVAVADRAPASTTASAGSAGTSVAAATAPAAGTGSLPFTGLGLAPIALLGAMLVAAGAGAHRVASTRS